NALGLAVALAGQASGQPRDRVAEQASGYFRRAVECDPSNVLAGLNLVEALAAAGQREAAIAQGLKTLAQLHQAMEQDAGWLQGGHFPPAFDLFRVEWERAAWLHAGHPKEE